MSDNGRGVGGKFVRGNRCALGNRGGGRRRGDSRWLELLREEVSEDRWRAIIAKAIEDAEEGDAAARSFLAKHLIPKRLLERDELRESLLLS